jgi:hypothetical protein
MTDDKRKEAIRIAWSVGRLKYKLQPRQKEAYDAIERAPSEEPFAMVCTRGFGKTFIGCTKAIEAARRHTNVNILIISSTLKNLRKIVKPAFDTLLEDCPDEFKPKYHAQDSAYEFPGKVSVHLCAAEHGHIEKIRGLHNVVLVLIDEAAFFGDEEDSFPLDHVIENIINPMFIRTKAKARVMMMSTPPETPNHPFQSYYQIAKRNGASADFTIYQSDIPAEKIEEERRRCKDENAWRRERLCEWVFDESRMIVPEFREAQHVGGYEPDNLFAFWDKYFSLDSGSVDKTVGLIAFYHFAEARLYVVDEIERNSRTWTTEDLADEAKKKETEHWGKEHKVYGRVADNDNQILISDLTRMHDFPIRPTSKDSLQAMVNQTRLFVKDGRLRVHPRCKLLIQTLKDGIWNKTKDEFARTIALGHMDALAALIYLIRNIDQSHNPVPITHGFDPATQYWDVNARQPQGTHALEKALVYENPFARMNR